jgi:3-methyladenine DNA glycosylase AlkD
MKEYTKKIHSLLAKHGDELAAQTMAKVTNGQFKFLGIKTVEQNELTKKIFVNYPLPKYDETKSIIRELFSFEEREYLYFGISLFLKRKKMWQKTDIVFIESLILTQPGWDTVEYISTEIVSQFYEMYPRIATEFIQAWISSKSQWLKAAAIMFQRTFKDQTNTELLAESITANISSDSDIVNRAIGAALRNYSKSNYKWVLDFVVKNSAEMNKKTKQEAIKWIDSKGLIK